MRESAQIEQAVTSGTGSGATTDNSGYAVGATTLTLASAGTGTILAGDVVTFAGDTANKYVVKTGDTDVSNGGTIVLAEPGLRVAMSAATKAITVVAASTRNMVFSRDALVLATRAPAQPDGPTLAVESGMIVDPRTGMAFQLDVYPLYHSFKTELSINWGFGCMKPEHFALSLG